MVKIANWNVARVLPFSQRAVKVLSSLREIDADLFILTETHINIAPRSDFHVVHSGEPDRPGSLGERMCSIWSKFSLQPLNDTLSDPLRCAAARFDHPQLGGVTVFGCVLPWLSDKWRGIPTKNGQAFTTALSLYCEDWEKIRLKFPLDTFILAGDFNQSLTHHHYYGSSVQKAFLEEVFRRQKLLPLTAYENDPINRECHPYACIDHICISESSQFKLISSERWPKISIPDKSLSDHFGIAVNLERCEQKASSDARKIMQNEGKPQNRFPRQVSSIISACALRFDGYKFEQNQSIINLNLPGKTLVESAEPIIKMLRLHEDNLLNFGAFFTLQRHLTKWGGEYLTNFHEHRIAYDFLFLHLYRVTVPEQFSSSYMKKWEKLSETEIESAAQYVRNSFRRKGEGPLVDLT